MADLKGGPQLRARLITIPFGDMAAILYGKKRVANLPPEGYIRTIHPNMSTAEFELMVIDPDFAPVVNLGDMPQVAAEVVAVDKPKGKGKR